VASNAEERLNALLALAQIENCWLL